MSVDKDRPVRPANTGPQGGQEEPGTQDLDQLLADIVGHTNNVGACNAVIRQATKKIGEELVERHIRILTTGIKAYRDRQEKYVETDKPDGHFYVKEDGKFNRHNTYTEALVKLLAGYKEVLDKLRETVNVCLASEATGEAYDKLEAVLKEHHIFF